MRAKATQITIVATFGIIGGHGVRLILLSIIGGWELRLDAFLVDFVVSAGLITGTCLVGLWLKVVGVRAIVLASSLGMVGIALGVANYDWLWYHGISNYLSEALRVIRLFAVFVSAGSICTALVAFAVVRQYSSTRGDFGQTILVWSIVATIGIIVGGIVASYWRNDDAGYIFYSSPRTLDSVRYEIPHALYFWASLLVGVGSVGVWRKVYSARIVGVLAILAAASLLLLIAQSSILSLNSSILLYSGLAPIGSTTVTVFVVAITAWARRVGWRSLGRSVRDFHLVSPENPGILHANGEEEWMNARHSIRFEGRQGIVACLSSAGSLDYTVQIPDEVHDDGDAVIITFDCPRCSERISEQFASPKTIYAAESEGTETFVYVVEYLLTLGSEGINLFRASVDDSLRFYGAYRLVKEARSRFPKAKDSPKENESEEVATSSSAPPLSAADEIEKLASLLERGILTQEEFDAKKKQLLGL